MARVFIGPRERRDVQGEILLVTRLLLSGALYVLIGWLATRGLWFWAGVAFVFVTIMFFFLEVGVEDESVLERRF